jgi:hypothetical protein
MLTRMFRRITRHCLCEFYRGDLRVRLFRVSMHEHVPFWLLWGVKEQYEYRLEFARRQKGNVFKDFATIPQLDIPVIAELLKPVNRYLNGFGQEVFSARELWRN